MRKEFLTIVIFITLFTFTFLSGIRISEAQEPYVIGYITDATGIFKANLHPESEGFRLYIDDLNARGGVNGHPIKLIIEDGKSEASMSMAVAKKLIEKDNVLALVGLGVSDAHPPVIELAKKARVPILTGYICISKSWDTQPGDVIFATGMSMHADYHAGGYTVARGIQLMYPRGTRMGILGMTLSGSRIWNDWVVEWIKKWGFEVLYRDEIAPGTVDVSSWCMKMVNANPDAVYSGASNVQMPLALTLEKMGYTKDFMITDFTPEADVAKIVSRLTGNGENLLWVSRYVSPNENIPELDKIRMAMKKYGANYPISARHCQGWVMGIIVEEALKKTGYPCTRESLITALEKTNVDTRGLTGGPIIFTSKDHHGPSWFKVYRWNANKKGSMPAKDWFKVETEGVAKK
jgi:branched-chain amino acid transport system substrate-binding protein